MKSIKKIALTVAFASIMSFTVSNAQGLYVNNYKVKDASNVILNNERTYITTKDFASAIGASHTYDSKTKSSTIKTDTNTYVFTSENKNVLVNGENKKISLVPYIVNNHLVIPVSVLKEFEGAKLYWNYKTKDLLINSEQQSISQQIKYNSKTDTAKLKKIIGKDSENYTFTYAITDTIKNEKYMTDGVYFIFKASEKTSGNKKVNGFFYMNVYSNDVYFYPIEASKKSDIKKYSNGKIINNYNANGKTNTAQLVATTRMVSDVKSSDNSLEKFTYIKVDTINKNYINALPKGNYYYYEASKKENNKLKPHFQIAQNTNTLEIFLFLKSDKGVNVIRLADKKIIKTI